MNTTRQYQSFALVEGPRFADAKFYGEWLLAAAKAEALWEKVIKDPRFERRIDALIDLQPLDDGATGFLYALLAENQISFMVIVEDELEGGQFALMAEMGFFVLAAGRYQMAIPSNLNIGGIRKAALRCAETKDKDGLHPERLITTMPLEQVLEWEKRLENMGEKQRCADRAVFLERLAKQPN